MGGLGCSGWNLCVLTAVLGLYLASGTQREKPLVATAYTEPLRQLEAKVAAAPADPMARRDLAQAYLDARSPGLALLAVEAAPEAVQASAPVAHVYARALAESGRAKEALLAQRRALAACEATGGCETWFLAVATRRADFFSELVHRGIEDAQAYPERSAVAYHTTVRQARLAVQ